ncbi:MAG: L-lactate permease [Acidobacteriota bacterium]|nr:L-lactate permease [Acidobacteriota bacterium]
MLALTVPFVLALTPIIWLVIALIGLKQQAWVASLGAMLVAVVAAMAYWHMTPINVATAALEGFLFALWPIVLVIIAAVFTYNLCVSTGAMETIKAMLASVSSDKRILTVLIAWCFGNFMEGMAGFGTAVAIPASMLVALDIDPITAILVCLIANGVPTMYGSVGIPTTTLAAQTGLDVLELGYTQSLQVLPFSLACPILMVMVVGGGAKALKGIFPIPLVAGLTFALPQILVAHLVGAELADVAGAVLSLMVTFIVAIRYSTRKVPQEYEVILKKHMNVDVQGAIIAWSPFILIFLVLLCTAKVVAPVYNFLEPFRSTVNIYAGNPDATLTFVWINTPGVLILICGILGGLAQGAYLDQTFAVLYLTVVQMSKTILTMLGILGCAKIMTYSGMIGSISDFFVTSLGGFYPLVAPVLGAIGTFVTGSGTSSEVLFGNVQLNAAHHLGINPLWLVASNSLGVSAGKMLSPQNIAIGCAAVDLQGRDGEIMGKIAPYAFGFVILMMIEIYVGALIGL